MSALTLAVCACALGPWVAALWATAGRVVGGSRESVRGTVHVVFWGCLTAAIVLVIEGAA